MTDVGQCSEDESSRPKMELTCGCPQWDHNILFSCLSAASSNLDTLRCTAVGCSGGAGRGAFMYNQHRHAIYDATCLNKVIRLSTLSVSNV